MGSDKYNSSGILVHKLFQFMLPVWGSIDLIRSGFRNSNISIHAPRMGSDPRKGIQWINPTKFQFTLPAWGATFTSRPLSARGRFFNSRSPWGNDFRYPLRPLLYWVFNSRYSSEERPDATGGVINIITFQFTLSVWGAILICLYFVLIKCIFNSRSLLGEWQICDVV